MIRDRSLASTHVVRLVSMGYDWGKMIVINWPSASAVLVYKVLPVLIKDINKSQHVHVKLF
jgi:hypothetical protein